MSKNILVIVGSPRKNGNTEILADAFIEGATESGNSVTKYSIKGKIIGACLDCKYCYKNNRCVLDDDMKEVYSLLSKTEMVVLASPVYFYGFSAQLKALIDRLHNPIRNSFQITSSALLSVCADKGSEVFEPIISTYKAIADYLHWEDCGIIIIDEVEKKGAVLGNAGLIKAKALGKNIT